jgi:hypothetical protein
MLWGIGSRIQNLKTRVWGLRSGVWDSESWVPGLRSRIGVPGSFVLGVWEQCLESRICSPESVVQCLGVRGGVWSLGNVKGIQSLD